ncbi:MAG TPA: fumarylacetoacetate hydrolase family protein [Spirochaetota bacterium]|nr:fumarylacetoacetate hydrolase family protein [Spirochaetota bacterium]
MRLIKFTWSGLKQPCWGIERDGKAYPVAGCTTAATAFRFARAGKAPTGRGVPIEKCTLLPPADERAHVYCAGLNYRDHAAEVRMPIPASPVFFTKSGGALAGAHDDIIYPESVTLLDYEVELALVIGARIGRNDVVTADNLPACILGITIMNDVSARDVQLSAGQWFLGKSFRTFAPLGPVIQTLDALVLSRLYALELELSVYNALGAPYDYKRQRGTTADMIFKPHELIRCLQEKFDLLPGDVIATGTPCGVALGRPSHFRARIAEILGIPQGERIARFLKGERRHNPKYLMRGDRIEARIRSADGVVDLGVQRNFVK